MNRRNIALIIPLILTYLSIAQTGAGCRIQNNAFISGEELYYKVKYNWGMIWLESAEAVFKVRSATYNNKKCYLFSGIGNTYPKYDWFFRVNDVFESYVDSLTFRPLKFKADIQEGNKFDKHTYLFNNSIDKAYTIINHGKKPVALDTIGLSDCSVDVLTAIYFARNLDYSHVKINDTIGMSILMDGKLFSLYVRYLGKDIYTSEELGTYKCIKFRPLLVEGSIFKKGEHMTVWVTDDKNKIPLYIETAIIVGTVKVYLMSFKGLRHLQEAKTGSGK